jgi:hypothetical protein
MRYSTILAIASAFLLCVACSGATRAADKAAGPGYKVGDKLPPSHEASAAPEETAAKGRDFKLTTWEELVPKDWDPMKELRGLNLDMLSDGDPRAQEALNRLKRAWDTAPTEPSMDNQRIRIAGFVVPLEGESDQLREFLLVPYFGACIHVPPPPANQIIHVKSVKPIKGVRTMHTLWVSGRLRAAISDTAMGTSAYRMEADVVAPYAEKR